MLSSRDCSWSVAIMTLLRVVNKILIRGCCVYESALVVMQPRRAKQPTVWMWIHQKTQMCEVGLCAQNEAAVTDTTSSLVSAMFSWHFNNEKAKRWKINTVKKRKERDICSFNSELVAWLYHPDDPLQHLQSQRKLFAGEGRHQSR